MHWIVLCSLCGSIGLDGRADLEAVRSMNRGAAVSVDLLAKTLIDQHDALNALALVYQEVSASRPGQPDGAYLRRFVAASRPGSFIRDNGHGHKRLHWLDDSKLTTLLVTPTESTLLENLNRLVKDLKYEHRGPAASFMEGELIFDVLCWWPYTDWPPPEIYGHANSMSALLKEKAYRLLPRKESVQSRPCYILELNDVNTIWIDWERPRCVLRREVYSPGTRAVASRYEMMEYREAGDGIWLPGRFRSMRFDPNAHTPQLRERVLVDVTFLVSDVKVNHDVPPETFRQNFSPGTVRKVVSAGMERYEPVRDGQAEHFESILRWSRAVTAKPAASDSGLLGRPFLIFLPVGVVGGAVAFVLARRASARRESAPSEPVSPHPC